ncbi:hypothetical protein CEXT_464241 [Caerostris extrusa]|uniref:Uncharacterized protein n=1 Tax=Caerostris extrusa TaxID=172846 RepID=A0AAV4TZC1_CAEEX|nr:hypothetical protein CEXT_464241 [Caerostris extrusa]
MRTPHSESFALPPESPLLLKSKPSPGQELCYTLGLETNRKIRKKKKKENRKFLWIGNQHLYFLVPAENGERKEKNSVFDATKYLLKFRLIKLIDYFLT